MAHTATIELVPASTWETVTLEQCKQLLEQFRNIAQKRANSSHGTMRNPLSRMTSSQKKTTFC